MELHRKIKAETGLPIAILKPGEEDKLSFIAENSSPLPFKFNTRIVLSNIDNKNYEYKQEITLAPREKKKLNISLPAGFPLGIWNINCYVEDKKIPGGQVFGQSSFAYMKPSGPNSMSNPDFTFGICDHIGRWSPSEYDQGAFAAAACGIKLFRSNVGWSLVQPEKDQWDFSRFDTAIALLEKYNMKYCSSIAYTPKWAIAQGAQYTGKKTSSARPDIEAWKNYVSEVAKHLGEKNFYYEIWNEPDHPSFLNASPEEYTDLMIAAYEEIKKVNPRLRVTTGGFATVKSERARLFHTSVLTKGKGYFDLYSHHEHGYFESFQFAIDNILIPLRTQYGNEKMPWFATETAISSAYGNDVLQAETLFKKLLFAWSRGAIGYNWYNLKNKGSEPNNQEHNFGLLSEQWEPKFVYGVYNTLSLLYGQASYVKDLHASDKVSSLLFKSPEAQILAVWPEKGQNKAALLFGTDAVKAEEFDMMGNSEVLPVNHGICAVSVQEKPISVKFTGASYVDFMGELASIPNGLIIKGKPLILNLSLHNPANIKQNVLIDYHFPSFLSGEKLPQSIELAPSENKIIPLHFVVNDNLPKGRESSEIIIALKYPYSNWNLNCSSSLKIAPLIENLPISQRAPDFVLNKFGQNRSRFANNPGTMHLLWQGPKDLSAKIWLSINGEKLILNAIVEDDIHVQKETVSNSCYQGDSIQFALAFPGQKGYWKLGAARHESGNMIKSIWTYPESLNPEEVLKNMSVQIDRRGTETSYELSIPFKSLGIDPSLAYSGFQFNLIVNDNDTDAREGWLEIAPGLGSNDSPAEFPVMLFKNTSTGIP